MPYIFDATTPEPMISASTTRLSVQRSGDDDEGTVAIDKGEAEGTIAAAGAMWN